LERRANFIEEENMQEQNLPEEQNATEWQAPPPPEKIVDTTEPPQMSEAVTLGNIFIEPGRTFEDLRRKPRFIFASLIIIVLATAFTFLFAAKIGEDGFRRFATEQLDKNSQTQGLSAEQKQQSISLQLTIMKVSRFLIPIFVFIGLLIGGLIYWLGSNAMGGSATFMHGVSAWTYSSFPPTVVALLANIIILFFKSVDDIDVASGQRGLVHANPSFFINGTQSPVLATILGTFDLFAIWGWILAAIGLQKLAKISSGAAWAIVLILALVSLTLRVLFALMSGSPM
jgi:hypothetical protein